MNTNGLKIAKAVWRQQIGVQRPRDRCGDHHNYGYRTAHAKGRCPAFSIRPERADAQKFIQDVVFGENGGQKIWQPEFSEFVRPFKPAPFLLQTSLRREDGRTNSPHTVFEAQMRNDSFIFSFCTSCLESLPQASSP